MAITYSISGGADAAKFNINASTGAVTFKLTPDFENPTDADANNIYLVQVKATDPGGFYDVQNLAITITDVAEGNIGTPLPPLTASGSLTVGSANAVIQNLLITGRIVNSGFANLTVKNCIINFPGGIGLDVRNASGGLTVQDVRFNNTAHATGINPNAGIDVGMFLDNISGPTNLTRVTVNDCIGMRVWETPASGSVTMSFIEGHNIRGQDFHTGGAAGHFMDLAFNSGPLLIEDFSCINDPANSYVEDVINADGDVGSVTFRRGLLDGSNGISGSLMMIEDTSNALIEDVDGAHFSNCAYGAFTVNRPCANTTYRRCRVKDQLYGNLGFGAPQSGGTVWISSTGCTNTRFESCTDWNVNYTGIGGGDHLWDAAGGGVTLFNVANANYTARSPIVNRTPGT